jgi:hypothetical protein
MEQRTSPLGSTDLRCLYSTRSALGAELERERSFSAILSGVMGSLREGSLGPDGTGHKTLLDCINIFFTRPNWRKDWLHQPILSTTVCCCHLSGSALFSVEGSGGWMVIRLGCSFLLKIEFVAFQDDINCKIITMVTELISVGIDGECR